MEFTPEDVTQLLAKWGKGDRAAFNKLIPVVYRELHKMAKRYMAAQAPGHTLQTTAIVNEAYLKLATGSEKNWANRAHFFAVAAKVMRRILVEYGREHRALKRGGAGARVALDEALLVTEEHLDKALLLDRSLDRLASVDPEHSRLVELRFFGGLSVEETAECLGISQKTVKRDWAVAKAWLHAEVRGQNGNQSKAMGTR